MMNATKVAPEAPKGKQEEQNQKGSDSMQPKASLLENLPPQRMQANALLPRM
jgi:hypothetical protein